MTESKNKKRNEAKPHMLGIPFHQFLLNKMYSLTIYNHEGQLYPGAQLLKKKKKVNIRK